MPISYPLTLPSDPDFQRADFRLVRAVQQTTSPFNLNQKVQKNEGEFWAAELTLPPMKPEQAREWTAFLAKLRGKRGTFKVGDPAGSSPRGSASGTPVIAGPGNAPFITFDGDSDSVDITDAAAFDISDALTVEAYVTLDETGSAKQSIVSKVADSNKDEDFDLIATSNDKIKFSIGDGSQRSVTGSTALSQGVPYHVAGVLKDSQLRVYVDGSQENTFENVLTHTFDSNDTLQSNSSFAVGGAIETYGDLGTDLIQLGYSSSDENGSNLSHFYSMDDSSGPVTDHAASTNLTASNVNFDVNTAISRTGIGGNGTDAKLSGSMNTWLGNNQFTVSFLVNSYSETGASANVMGVVEGSQRKEIILNREESSSTSGQVNGQIALKLEDQDGNKLEASPSTNPNLNDGNLHHVVIAVDTANNNATFTIDGSTQTTDAATTTTADNFSFTNDINVFARNNAGSSDKFLNADLDELRLYSRELTDSQAQNQNPNSFAETVKWQDFSYSSKLDKDTLQLTTPQSLNIPSNTTLKAKVHRTDGTDTIQESSDELDLSNSFPIDVTGITTNSKHFTIELTEISTTDRSQSPEFDQLKLEGRELIQATNAANDIRIAGRPDGAEFLQGDISDVRLWSEGRTTSEIGNNLTDTLAGSETNLAGYWKLKDGSGTTATDSTSNNNDGTLINDAAWVNKEGNIIIIRGWTANETNVLKKGDYIEVNDRLKITINNEDADGNGVTKLNVEPAFRSTVSEGTSVVTSDPKGEFRLSTNEVSWSTPPGSVYEGMTIPIREVF